MRISLAVSLLLGPSLLFGQATPQSAAPITASRAYSVWLARHAATVKLAELANGRASSPEVQRFASTLAREEKDASDRLQAEATKANIQISTIERDTTHVLLQQATAALGDKSGAAFDVEWASRAHAWLSTLVLDNNINISHKLPAGELKELASAYSRFQFRLSSDASALKKKLGAK